MIGGDTERGGVRTVSSVSELWPSEVKEWQYWARTSSDWISDPLLSVTGRPLCHYLSSQALLLEGAPDYPEKVSVRDGTGDHGELAGVYQRQRNTFIWKYRDYQLYFDGKPSLIMSCLTGDVTCDGGVWCISGYTTTRDCQLVTGWDFTSPEYVWPRTDTLHIRDFPASITIDSTGPAKDIFRALMGQYDLDPTQSALLRPVYKKEDYYIFYSSIKYFLFALLHLILAVYKHWMVGKNITQHTGYIKSEEAGLQTVPTTGWVYTDGSRFVNGDPTLVFRHN